MNPAQTTSRRVPDLEDLAAYLDGRLQPAERAAVEARLAEDADYYETMLETVRFREEMAAEGAASPEPAVATAAPRWPTGLWSGLAAAAMLVLAVGIWQLNRPSAEDVFYAAIDPQAVLGIDRWDARTWKVNRSSSLPNLPSPQLAFRLGTQLVDLHLAVTADDADETYHQVIQARQLVDQLDLVVGVVLYGELAAAVEDGQPADELQRRATEAETRVTAFLGPRTVAGQALRAGRWCEMARLSALGQERRALLAFLRRPPRGLESLDARAEDPLKALRLLTPELAADGDVDGAVFENALKGLGELQEILGG